MFTVKAASMLQNTRVPQINLMQYCEWMRVPLILLETVDDIHRYYTPKTAAWNNVGTHTGIADVASYTNGKVVLSSSDFFEAQMDFSSINAVAGNVKCSTGDNVKNAGGTGITKLEQIGQQLRASQRRLIFQTTSSQYVQIGGAGDFKPKRILITQIFPLTIIPIIKGLYSLEVKDGSGNYYIRTADLKVADVNNGASTTITGAQLTTAIGSLPHFVNSGTVYTPNATLTGISAHNAGSAYDTTGGAVSYPVELIKFIASSNFKGSFTITNALAQNQILKEGGGNWYQINNLSTYTAWDGTNNPYNQNDIVQDPTDSNRYTKHQSELSMQTELIKHQV